MTTVNFKLILTISLLISNVFAFERVPCDLSDVVCTTQASVNIYHNIVNGKPEFGIDRNDPLHRDSIQSISQRLNYTLTNAYLYGLKHCAIHQLKFNMNELTWEFYLTCPRLILEADYDIKGEIMSLNIDGNGPCRIVYDNYIIGLTGGLQLYNGPNENSYIHVTEFKMSYLDVRGLATYQFNNLYNSDPERAFIMSNLLNANWQRVTAATQEPAMYAVFEKFIESVNKYLKHVPIKQLFARTVL
ncbi:uncharacterized protein LOC119630370 [Bombyx mori]|uniref:Uncharacterized protein n=1 Tax=Bombyx mori TaxID=7091 RepID=A0A8R2R377_BOMMO|nr:uncharacterized protein LOC119630370 [Bombyx mori]